MLLALDHIEATFHHELLHRIELMDSARTPVFMAWEHNRAVVGAWREECFAPQGKVSGAEDRATTAEFLFTGDRGTMRAILSRMDARAQKLRQLQEVYVQASQGLMGPAFWEQRLATADVAR